MTILKRKMSDRLIRVDCFSVKFLIIFSEVISIMKTNNEKRINVE